MPTQFNDNFMDNNNDEILAIHVKQFIQPINDLENDVDQLQLDVANKSDVGHTHTIAQVDSLQTELNGKQDTLNVPDDVPGLTNALNGKEDSLPTGVDGQLLQADSAAPTGVSWVNAPSGGGATSLSGLSDVDNALSPMDDHVLQYESGEFKSKDLSSAGIASTSDITGIQSQLANKADVSALAGKEDSLPTGVDGQLLQADSAAPTGVSWVNAPSGGGSTELSDLTDVDDTLVPNDGEILQYVGGNNQFESRGLSAAGIASDSDISGLQTQINGKEDTANKGQAGGYAELDGGGKLPSSQLPSHVHDAADIVSGTLSPSQGGVPTGGSDGQVLTKVSGAPAWADAATSAPSAVQVAELSQSTYNQLASTTETIFDFDTSLQVGTDCVPSTSSNRITVQSSGFYEISYSGQWVNNNNGTTVHFGRIRPRINGSNVSWEYLYMQAEGPNQSPSKHFTSSKTFLISLSANDYIDLTWYTNDGSTSNTYWQAPFTKLLVKKIS